MNTSTITTKFGANDEPQLVDQSIAVRPTYIRAPRTGNCPHTGLSRSKLYELISGDNPQVKSISLKRGDQQRATRLIHFQSLLEYLASFEKKNTNANHAEDNQ